MWKKDEMPGQTPAPSTESMSRPERPAAPAPPGERATIGRSITIKGEVTGDEDLLIQGRVEGSVDLKQHSVTVGPDGEVKASIAGRVVTVEGTVEGNLTGAEQVILRASSSVQGDIAAPRVVLEDGARFRGGVDMGDGDTQKSHRPRMASPKPAAKVPEPLELGAGESRGVTDSKAEVSP